MKRRLNLSSGSSGRRNRITRRKSFNRVPEETATSFPLALSQMPCVMSWIDFNDQLELKTRRRERERERRQKEAAKRNGVKERMKR